MFSSRHRLTLLYSNVVKFVRREIGEIVRYLLDKTLQKFRLPFKLLLLRGSRPKSARTNPNNVLRVLQTESKSVHFRRSYRRTREHALK